MIKACLLKLYGNWWSRAQCPFFGSFRRVSSFEVLRNKRISEAKCSVVVQVKSKTSVPPLYAQCTQYGDVHTMIYYSPNKSQSFVLVQFEEETSARALLRECRFSDPVSVVPVQSRFLWLNKNRNNGSNASTAPPLVLPQYVSQPELDFQLSEMDQIEEQLIHQWNVLQLDDLGVRLRHLMTVQITELFEGIFPFCSAVPFGSSANGFGKNGCDIDIALNLNPQQQESSGFVFHSKPTQTQDRLQTQWYLDLAGDLLDWLVPGCSGVEKILRARVPIVKYKHGFVGAQCDLSINQMSGVWMAELLWLWSALDRRVAPLVFAVQRWARANHLTSPVPGHWLTNFQITLLVCYFLMKKERPVIPTVNTLEKLAEPGDKQTWYDGSSCFFARDLENIPKSVNPESLGELFKGFFEFFHLFPFGKYSLSVVSGEMAYKQEKCDMVLVNPIERTLNVTKNVTHSEVDSFKEKCGMVSWLVDGQPDLSYLSLLNLTETMRIYQRHVKFQVKNLFNEDQNDKQMKDNSKIGSFVDKLNVKNNAAQKSTTPIVKKRRPARRKGSVIKWHW